MPDTPARSLTWQDVAMEAVRTLPALVLAVLAFLQANKADDRSADNSRRIDATDAKVVRFYGVPKGE